MQIPKLIHESKGKDRVALYNNAKLNDIESDTTIAYILKKADINTHTYLVLLHY